MKNIKVKSDILHNEKRLMLYFDYDIQLTNILKRISGRKWSSSNKCWHISDSKENIDLLFKVFKGIAWLDFEKTQYKSQITKQNGFTKDDIEENTIDLNSLKIDNFRYWLKSKRYSEKTIKTYIDSLKIFLNFYPSKTVENITNNDIIRFNNEYILKNKYSASFQNQVVNAIKLFFKTIENISLDIDLIHRPKRSHQLPNVLSKDEVKAILNAPSNLKHKAMLSLIYGCGLRRSELLNLKPTDIDSKRKLLIIKNAKGRKDRVAPISDKLIEMLREYYINFKPKAWLFEGQNAGEKYSEQSLQSVLKRSVEKVKIKKAVSLHWLRHSYATHLLESGTDLKYIQELLGHKSSKTTEIYTHVSTKSIQNIKSPFDDL